jgi:Domain of unknown function (DUF4347)
MFLLEDRVLFDAAVAIDITEVQQHEDSLNEPSDYFDDIESTEQTAESFLQSPYEAQQAMPLPVNPYIDAVVRDALDGNLTALGLDGDLALPEAASATGNQTQVLLISSSLANADELYEAAGENTLAIRYDAANTTTEQLLEQIEQSLDGEKIDRVGIAQGSDSNGRIDLLTSDSDSELWQGLNELMAEDATIDLFASNMSDSEFSDALETLTGHEVNYSTDITGSDGDWILENGDVNLADTYFDGEVAQNVNFTVIPAEPVHELAIINSSVMDAENIIDDLGDNVDVLILNVNVDPLDQINEYLDANNSIEYDAMHIISHGNDGYFVLNGQIVDGDYATDNAGAFAAIGEHLTDDGDIMIYGCDLAANAEGQSLVAQLADLTGADIAASTDATSSIGGDWNLEYSIGLIDSSAFAVEGYAFSLANIQVINGNDSGTGSLRQAVIDIGTGEEITFNSSVSTVVLSSQIEIDDSMTITGNGINNTTVQVTSPASSNFRVFYVNPGSTSTVTIQAMTISGGNILTGGTPANYGAGISHNNGTLNLDSVKISTGYAWYGGGIYSNSGNLNISDSNITGNGAFWGGAVYNTANATVSSTTINDNIAQRGGGIYNTSTISISQSTLDNNTSTELGGGAIFNFRDSAVMTIEYTTISNNEAPEGAGIYNDFRVSVTILNSTINNNSATGNGGGAVANSEGTVLTIVNSTLALNDSRSDGGAIYSDASTVSLINSTVSGNSADNNGGGIYTASATVTYAVNSAIINNNADSNGGDIYNSGSTVYAYYSRYLDTSGTISIQTDAPNQINIYDNELGALNDNGGSTQTMMVNSGSTMIENGTESYYNSTDGYYFKAADNLYHKLTAYATTVTMSSGDKLTTDQRGITRQTNQTIGAVEPDYYRTTTASGNWATLASWEISHDNTTWNAATTTPYDINSSSITINHNTTINSDVNAAETTITSGNELIIDSATLTITDGTGTDLTINGQLTITGDLVLSSSATATATAGSYVLYNGGDQNIAVIAYAKLGFEGDNTTKTFGDGITSVTEEILLTSAGMILTGSGLANATVQVATPGTTAARVFYSNPGAGNTLTIENITIKGGDISGLVDDAANGGTLFHESGTLNISSTVISGSKAVNGGAIFSKATLTITDSTISSGHATNNGGGLYNSYSTMTITGSTVDNNLADRSGGGISSYQDISTTVDDSTISNNQGRYGGILSYDSTLVLLNSTVSGNNSTSIVGGVGSFKGTISLLNTTISNNTATVAFGTVYNNRSQLYLVNSILIGNPLSGGGDDNAIQTSSAGGNSFAFYSWYDATKIVGNLTTNVNAPNLTSSSDGTLGALADNGGSTWTMAVQTGSNIIEAGTYIYHNSIDSYYFASQDGNTYHQLNYDTFTPTLPGGKITTDQREFTRDDTFIPTMGAYEVNTTMVDELPKGAEWSSDEFSDLIKVHRATQNDLDVALMEFTA